LSAELLKSGDGLRRSAEILGRQYGGHLPRIDGSTDGGSRALGPEVEVVVPERRGIAAKYY